MENNGYRRMLAFGVILMLLGGLFLLSRVAPGLFGWMGALSWPLIIVGAGVLLLLVGALAGAPGLAVPAAIVGGIGGLLYWQNATGNWQSWAYAWTLIPGFVGVGVILAGLLEGKASAVGSGLWLVVISAILFVVFSAIMSPFVGGPVVLGRYWPVLLIVLGALLLGQAFFQRRSRDY
jgi:hypothetical protein